MLMVTIRGVQPMNNPSRDAMRAQYLPPCGLLEVCVWYDDGDDEDGDDDDDELAPASTKWLKLSDFNPDADPSHLARLSEFSRNEDVLRS